MKRMIFVLAAVVLSGSAAFADVTVTMAVTMGAATMTVDGTMVVSVKGSKFRSESKVMGQEVLLLGDGVTRQVWKVDQAAKQFEPFDPQQAFPAAVSVGDVKVGMTPNGQTKELLGQVCQGYTLEMSMPMTVQGETVTVRMTGPVWMAKEGQAVAEMQASQKTFAELGMAMSPIGQGPQAKALMEASKAMMASGVIVEQNLVMTMEGTGQMAQALSQVGGMTMTTRVTSLSIDPIPDERFAIPEGYTKK